MLGLANENDFGWKGKIALRPVYMADSCGDFFKYNNFVLYICPGTLDALNKTLQLYLLPFMNMTIIVAKIASVNEILSRYTIY